MPPNFRPPPAAHPRPPVLLAAVRERMTEVAGEVADGLLGHSFCTAEVLREVTLPALERGLERGGRARGDVEVTASVFVATTDAEWEANRRRVAFYGSTPGLPPRARPPRPRRAVRGAARALARRRLGRRCPALVDDDVLALFVARARRPGGARGRGARARRRRRRPRLHGRGGRRPRGARAGGRGAARTDRRRRRSSRRRRREGATLYAVIGGLMLVMLMAALDSTIVSTALPTIVGDLGGLEHISWVVTAYLLAQTVVMPLLRQARRPLRAQARAAGRARRSSCSGRSLCGQAQSMTELIAFRAIQGLGGGGLMVSAQAALGDVVSPRERGQLLRALRRRRSAWRRVVGPLLGGFLTTPAGLALDLLRERAGRRRRVRRPAAHAAARHTARISTRSTTSGPRCSAIALTALVLLTTLGGNQYDVGLAVHRRARRARGPRGRRLRLRRAAAPPSRCCPTALWRNPRLRRGERDGLHRRVRAVRRRRPTCRSSSRWSAASTRPSPGSRCCR